MWLVPAVAGAAWQLSHGLSAAQDAQAKQQRVALQRRLETQQRTLAARQAGERCDLQLRTTMGQARLAALAASAAADTAAAMADAQAHADGLFRQHSWWRPLFVPLRETPEEVRTRRALLLARERCAQTGAAAHAALRRHEEDLATLEQRLDWLRTEARRLAVTQWRRPAP